ncbi:MAG: isochorismate synthase [Nocardioidaceae bacterium]|nr:MAG: isochorismate synthase [Nocardioidaceae bacterium]
MSSTRALFYGTETIVGDVLATSIGTGSTWLDALVSSLAPGQRAAVALPFGSKQPAIAHTLAPADTSPLAMPNSEPSPRHTVIERPTVTEYADNVRAALGFIQAGIVEKVVLGRGVDVISDPPLDASDVIARLLRQRPGRYVFGVPLTGRPNGPVLVGASPELLARRQGRILTSLPLAGSAPRSDDPTLDRRRCEQLLDSAKDLTEHAFVVEQIMAALEPICIEIVADPQPRLVSTDTLHHLGTQIQARLTEGNGGLSALHLACLLHPTPAVGGVPTAAALGVITELEEEDRGPLAGAVGWVDADGNGEFAVTIRAGVLDGERLRLFAGAGIVAGSDPETEVRETTAKLTTMMKAVGL